MPPSWHPVPACVRHARCRRNHSSLPLRRLESDAEQRRLNDRSRRNYSSLPLRRLESDADHLSRNDRCRRNHFSLPQCRKESDAEPRCRYDHCRRAIPHCSSENAASILKSGLEIKNRCTQEGINRQNLASIPKSSPEIMNRCTKQSIFSTHPQHASSAHPPARVQARILPWVFCMGTGSTVVRQRFDSGGKSGC